jgi:hypothetical protein
MRYIVALLLLSALSFAQSADIAVSPKAKQIEDSAIVIDTHADTPGRFVDEHFDPATDAGTHHWDFAKVHHANLGAEFFSIWVDPDKYKGHYVDRALDMIDSVHLAAQQHPDEMMMAGSVADIERARCVGRFASAHCKKKVAALMEESAKYEAFTRGGGSFPVILSEGRGSTAKDADGNLYINMAAGVAVSYLAPSSLKMQESVFFAISGMLLGFGVAWFFARGIPRRAN